VDFYDSSQVRSIISYLKFFFKSVKNSNIKKFFYFSSGGAIYGKNNSRLITEDSPLNPCSSYGLEKKIIEDLIIDILWEAKNIRTYILRPSNIYGFSPFLKSHGIVHKLNIAFLNKITFDINSSLDTIRDYIYINDLIDAVNFINKSNCDSNIFNVGSSIGTSTSDVIQIVQSIHKNQISINIANKNITSTNHISSNILNIDKIKHITNWIPKTIFFDGIVETCAKYKSFYEK
jgi:UDP-glucose 4-epimerase